MEGVFTLALQVSPALVHGLVNYRALEITQHPATGQCVLAGYDEGDMLILCAFPNSHEAQAVMELICAAVNNRLRWLDVSSRCVAVVVPPEENNDGHKPG